MEDAASSPPYWQLPAAVTHRRGQSSLLSSALLNSSIAIIVIPSLAMLLLVFIAMPSIISLSNPYPYSSSPIPKPVQMKNGLATLNVVLVVFAIFCGILSRGKQHESSTSTLEVNQNHDSFGGSIVPGNSRERVLQLFGEEKNVAPPVTTVSAMRTARSYPDSRHQDPWETAGTAEQLRFFDNFDLQKFYPSPSVYDNRQQFGDGIDDRQGSVVRDVPVDTFVIRSKQHSPRPAYAGESTAETVQANLPGSSPSTEEETASEDRRKERKKKNASREIATALASLYSRRRKRKRNHKIVQDFKTSIESPPQFTSPPPHRPPPPPPPPPPSSSVFQSLFTKRNKSKKKKNSISPPQQPPPLPPQHFSQPQKQKNPIVSLPNDQSPPPLNRTAAPHRPPKSLIIDLGEEMVDESHSPLSPVPPPPPPEANFLSQGGLARVQTRRSVDELGAVDEEMWCDEIDGGDENGLSSSSVGWPSPDVDAKADKFIARHHEGWKLERLVSRRRRETRWADEEAYWAHIGP